MEMSLIQRCPVREVPQVYTYHVTYCEHTYMYIVYTRHTVYMYVYIYIH